MYKSFLLPFMKKYRKSQTAQAYHGQNMPERKVKMVTLRHKYATRQASTQLPFFLSILFLCAEINPASPLSLGGGQKRVDLFLLHALLGIPLAPFRAGSAEGLANVVTNNPPEEAERKTGGALQAQKLFNSFIH